MSTPQTPKNPFKPGDVCRAVPKKCAAGFDTIGWVELGSIVQVADVPENKPNSTDLYVTVLFGTTHHYSTVHDGMTICELEELEKI